MSAISDDGSLLRVGRDGAIEAVLEMPWKHLARSHSLQRQSLLARDDVTNRCIAALSASDGIAAYDTSRSVWFRGFQVPVATGRVDTERRKLEGGSFVVSSRLSPPARTGYALAASRGRAFVAIGSGAASFRIIDVHDVRDGAYLKTFRSATPVELLAASSTHLLVASSVDGYPTLIAYTMDSLIRALSRPHPR